MWIVVLRTVLLAYLGFTALVYLFQTKLVFPAGRDVHSTPAVLGLDFDDVRLEVDGETTHGWYVPAENRRGVILFSHGNAGTVADRMDSIRIFHELGFDVFIYDYGGYGHSSGKPSESRCYADVRACWDYLLDERAVPPGHIVLFGRSLGAAVAADLASEVSPGAIVLESPFLSAVQIAREAFPFLPVRLLLRHRFDTTAKVADFTAPLLVIHSPEDEIIPFRHGRELFERSPEPKDFLEIRGSHNEGFYMSGRLYTQGLADFLHPQFPAPERDLPVPAEGAAPDG